MLEPIFVTICIIFVVGRLAEIIACQCELLLLESMLLYLNTICNSTAIFFLKWMASDLEKAQVGPHIAHHVLSSSEILIYTLKSKIFRSSVFNARLWVFLKMILLSRFSHQLKSHFVSDLS